MAVTLASVLLAVLAAQTAVQHLDGGSVVKKTLGAIWPMPRYIIQSNSYLFINAQNFQFNYTGINCPFIDAAIVRYQQIIFSPPRFASSLNTEFMFPEYERGELNSISISMWGTCEVLPHPNMYETYVLKVDSEDLPMAALLKANSTWGILRGLESFSQMVYHDSDHNFYVNSTSIIDFPRFPYRGFMLDSSRHYVPIITIKQHLDAMSYNKMNVFHWHITDDESFPYESQKFQNLSRYGAWNPRTHIYTFDDIASITKYAANLGIRVIPEFDTPGHTRSWGPGTEDLLTPCYSKGQYDGTYGPINPTLNSTYDFLNEFFEEAGKLFPEDYFHMGGDEVDYQCWMSNPNISDFMQSMQFGTDYSKLEEYYMNRLLDIVTSLPNSKQAIVWQEVFDNGCKISTDTVVNVWKGSYESELSWVTGRGYQAILSSCWYLSDIHYGAVWQTYYNCEPLSFQGSEAQYKLVIGGSGCIWGEFVDATNLISRTWPSASAIAEKLWSAIDMNDSVLAIPRLEEHRCRMMERGINAQPSNGANFCPCDYLVPL